MKKEKNPLTIFKTRRYIKHEKDQKYYPYSGIETYLGMQGGGKTITAVKRIKEILKEYPKVQLISNVIINDIETEKPIHYYKNCEQLVDELRNIDINNNEGYLIFMDEGHVVLAELFGRTDPIFLTFLSQQRKLSIHFIITSQMFNYLMKPIRKYLIQSGSIVMCKKYFKVIQFLKYIDMETIEEHQDGTFTYKRCKNRWYIHTEELYKSYDTFAVISQIQGLMKGELKYEHELDTTSNTTI